MKVFLDKLNIKPWNSWYSVLYNESTMENSPIEFSTSGVYVDYNKTPIAVYNTTNVMKRLWYNGTINKHTDFTMTVDAEKHSTGLTKMLRSYFSVCLRDDPDNDGELICSENINIFSPTEVPFELFNNVYFHGLQPNPKMHKVIKESKLFISPDEKMPRVAIDAMFLGTPVLVPDTPSNCIMIPKQECLYKDEEDLKIKLLYFSNIDVASKEYKKLVDDCFTAVRHIWSPENSLRVLKESIENGRYNET